MRAVELFAGVGGFRLGLERAGHQVVWANEWDKYACDTYNKNYGGSIDRRDITTIPATDIPDHDIICGGFPCQAFSVAGKRRGFDETRGTLFFEILRIARHHRTPYLLLENVKGLLNHDGGRTFEVILEALDESGYDCQWQVLNSKDFGVPQSRERVFIIGHLRDRPRPGVFPLAGDNRPARQPSNDVSERSEAFIKTRHLSQNGSLISDSITLLASEIPHIIKVVGHIYKGTGQAGRVYDRDGLSPTLSTMENGGQKQPKIFEDARIRKLTPLECERLQGFPDTWTEGMNDTQRYKQMGNAVTVNVIEAIGRQLCQ